MFYEVDVRLKSVMVLYEGDTGYKLDWCFMRETLEFVSVWCFIKDKKDVNNKVQCWSVKGRVFFKIMDNNGKAV